MRIRLTDIAEHAGTSISTVSRVMNGKPGVADDVRQRVLAAMDLLGYERPKQTRGRAAGLVGLVVPELSNPIFPAFAQAVENVLAMHGYTPLLCTQSPGGTTEDAYIDALIDHQVDGIVFVSGLHADTRAHHGRYHDLATRGVPMVLVNGYAPDVPAPSISADDAAGVELALRHLVSLGHRRIGLVVGQDRFVPAQRKTAAFLRCLVAMGLAADEAEARTHVITSFYSLEGGQASTTELLASGHTAVVCASDMMALGAVRAASAAGHDVPHGLSVVGYDDSLLAAYAHPALTTVRQPVDAMSQAAVSTLLAQIGGERVSRTEMLFAPELVARHSTGTAP